MKTFQRLEKDIFFPALFRMSFDVGCTMNMVHNSCEHEKTVHDPKKMSFAAGEI
jgi:hypothetical protein